MYGIANRIRSPSVIHLNTLLSSRLICLNNTINRNKIRSIIVKVAMVSTVTFKNSKGVPTNKAVVKKVSPRSIKINFLFIVVVCSLCRHSLAANGGGMKSCRLRAISCQVTQKLKRATNLE